MKSLVADVTNLLAKVRLTYNDYTLLPALLVMTLVATLAGLNLDTDALADPSAYGLLAFGVVCMDLAALCLLAVAADKYRHLDTFRPVALFLTGAGVFGLLWVLTLLAAQATFGLMLTIPLGFGLAGMVGKMWLLLAVSATLINGVLAALALSNLLAFVWRLMRPAKAG